MKRKAGILTGILFLMLAQVFLVVRRDEKPEKPVLTAALVQAADLPDGPWLENPDESLPAIVRVQSPGIRFSGELTGNSVADPRFRYTLAGLPDPQYLDRPPPEMPA